uniref:Paramyosin-like n=1 Tax=Oryza barthii TaxID=65489 RepID=A0A679BAV5_9ORYZ|nr:paramyosin-like [Oryza barthii]
MNWFGNFYEGFSKDSRSWFAYAYFADFELPADFRFDEINSEKFEKSREVFIAAISPCILPVGIHQGRNIQISYEFYYPMSAARQMGMGQLPIGLFFSDKIQTRGEITSALMMDRMLSIQGPPLDSMENIELAMLRSSTFDRWWTEWKKHLFHQSASMYLTDIFPDMVPQTIESSPPHISQSGETIKYATGILPNCGGLAPSTIGYNAPKTSTLLHGQTREPIPSEVRKRKGTKPSAAVPSATKKKALKKQKVAAADYLPNIDPEVERFLDEEEIEEAIDEAAADRSEAIEKTPAANIPAPQKTPPTLIRQTYQPRKKKLAAKKKPAPPPSLIHSPTPIQHESSEHTPSAKGSHHVEDQPAPAIPALADMFSFDIKQFMDEEEETSSKALAPLADDLKTTLKDIAHRLESSLDALVVDCGPIRARFEEIQNQIPDDVAEVISPAVFLGQYRFKLERSRQRIADRRERKELEATIQANRQSINEEKAKLDGMMSGPSSIQVNIDRLKNHKIELLAELEACYAELALEEQKLANLPKAIEEQTSKLKSSIKHLAEMNKSMKAIPGIDAADAQAIEEVEQNRQRAISAIHKLVSAE